MQTCTVETLMVACASVALLPVPASKIFTYSSTVRVLLWKYLDDASDFLGSASDVKVVTLGLLVFTSMTFGFAPLTSFTAE